jgi:hypothetical protein
MFPEEFARTHIETFTSEGDYIFDPFSGRGTTLFQSLLMKRHAIAMDINPVAFCISGAKAEAPALDAILNVLGNLEAGYKFFPQQTLEKDRQNLPPFFRRAFYHTTLKEILYLRRVLNWHIDPIHRFITTLVLGSLHGEMDKSKSYFSNQMPRTISTKPTYSLNYWRINRLWPRKRKVFDILRSRAMFRLRGETPQFRGEVALADARHASSLFASLEGRIKAVITSPPYFNVTNYEEDQWLRLWFLGHSPNPTYKQISKDDRYGKKDSYWRFLKEVWDGIAPLLQNKARLVCRIGAKGMSAEEITEGLTDSIHGTFPKAQLQQPPVISLLRKRQTDSFRPGSTGCMFELDYIFRIG